MAIIKSGILGGFSGSVAQVNGYNHNCKSIIRAKKKANKQPSNRILKANGTNLQNLVKVYNLAKVDIAKYMSLDLPDIEYNWNDFTRTFLTQGNFTLPHYMSLAVLGEDQFISNLKFVPSFVYTALVLRIRATKLNSMKVKYPDVKWNLRIVKSTDNSTFTNSGNFSSNQIALQANQLMPNIGDYSIMIFWFSSAASGLHSQAAIAINSNLG